jgi:simple sugar transport system permease protein
MTTQVEQPVQSKPILTPTQRIAGYARRYSLQIGIVAVLALMLLFLIIAAPKTFLSSDIYKSFANSIPFYGIVALPITMLIIAQEIDLSFGSIMAVSVLGYLGVFNLTGSPFLALIGCLATGFLVGLINGFIVVKIGIPSLIATIGMQFFWRGFVIVVTNGRLQLMGPAIAADTRLRDLLVGRLFDAIPMQFIWMVVVAVAVWLLLNRHRFGAHVYLIGDNNNSARLMGINVDQRRMLLFAIVGLAAGFAGLLNSLQISTFFQSLGDGYLLQTLAAVFLGGTPVLGGTGTILGTFVGCFIIGIIEPGTVAIGLTGFWTQLIYGLIIVVSVGMHTILRRRIR